MQILIQCHLFLWNMKVALKSININSQFLPEKILDGSDFLAFMAIYFFFCQYTKSKDILWTVHEHDICGQENYVLISPYTTLKKVFLVSLRFPAILVLPFFLLL